MKKIRLYHIILAIMAVILLNAVISGEGHSPSYSQATDTTASPAAQTEDPAAPIMEQFESNLKNEFEHVLVKSWRENGQTIISGRCWSDGMSSAVTLLKEGEKDPTDYVAFRDTLVDICSETQASAEAAGLNEPFVEIEVYDDIEMSNYTNGMSGGAASLLTIWRDTVVYDKLEDDSVEASEPVEEITLGKQQALRSAQDYLSVMPFSFKGLVKQLKYEGYSQDEAEYGAARCGADWNEMAAQKAASYLELMAFSRQGLIEQLEYEGFTHDQAVYGAKANGYN